MWRYSGVEFNLKGFLREEGQDGELGMFSVFIPIFFSDDSSVTEMERVKLGRIGGAESVQAMSLLSLLLVSSCCVLSYSLTCSSVIPCHSSIHATACLCPTNRMSRMFYDESQHAVI